MKKTTVVATLLLLLGCVYWNAPAQQSASMKVPVEGGEQPRLQQPLTNESIMRLAKIGFSDETIVSMVNHEQGDYSLSVDDLIALRQAGVSEKVIAAMLSKMAAEPTPRPRATAPMVPPATVDRPVETGRSINASSRPEVDSTSRVPREHGLYCQAPDRLVPIEGQVVSFSRSGSALSSKATFGIISRKGNVQILGESSNHTTSSRPVFYYRAAQATDAAGGSAGDLVLVRMRVKGKRRQFEIASSGAWRTSEGISIRSQLQVIRKQIEPDMYKLSPREELKPGEYAFYLFRGYELPGFVYDFSVE